MSQPWLKGILFKSTELTDHGADAYTGMIREHLGRIYMLVKTSEIIGNGVAVMKDTTTGDDITVIPTAAVTDRALGISQVGSTTTVDTYIWVMIRGRGFASPTGTWVDGDMVGPAVDGTTSAVAADAIGSVYGIAIKDSSATVINNAIMFDFGFGWCSDATP